MLTVLDVHVLPRADRSRTARVRKAFFSALEARFPDLRRVELDLSQDVDKLPAWDAWDIQAKFEMMYGEGKLDEVAASRWEGLVRLTDQLHAADLVVISAPMWNFGIPWHLKRWIDAVVQARLTFEIMPDGYHGLLKGRRAVIVTSRDGEYLDGKPYNAYDFHLPYLKAVLGLMGLGPIHEVVAEGLGFKPRDAVDTLVQEAEARAVELAQTLELPSR